MTLEPKLHEYCLNNNKDNIIHGNNTHIVIKSIFFNFVTRYLY